MAETDVKERVSPKVSRGDGPPMCHLARMSERRFDHCVETLCGLIRTLKPPRPNATNCPKCEEVAEMISALDRMR